ncbi:MAG: helix-turn-helix domain-containing protein [Actinobacteria bacterium]|nr:helix-turn-helix domain-containing protein [Actinomycetota bacterium]
MDDIARRAARHAALGDPVRLGIVDELSRSDRAPVELRRRFGLESNLLAHHLDVLEGVGLITRSQSSGDGRRRYVHLLRDTLDAVGSHPPLEPQEALFVCTANSARSQLAAALWRARTGAPATSAGTQPAERVHPGAVAAARRAGLDLSAARPRAVASLRRIPALRITVCDRAYEDLDATDNWLHWSITDPVPAADRAAFDAAVRQIDDRIRTITRSAA